MKLKKVLPTYVATDDDRILKVIQSEGGDAILTSKSCLNGTQRVAEALKKLDIYPEVILNIQGDEPLVREDDIRNLISLMDNFRVFEPIIGFSAQGSAQSLSWLIYDNLVNEEVILFGSAAATSIMTIIGIAIILTPVLIRTWREFRTNR